MTALLTAFEHAWLDFAYDMMTRPMPVCDCEPYNSRLAFRWPGFMGSNYRGILFVGARHNAAGLKAAGMGVEPLGKFAKELREWTCKPRHINLDEREREEICVIKAMRSAYRDCMPRWSEHGSPLAVFRAVKDVLASCTGHLGTWDDVAFVNLARCYMAPTKTGQDDAHIISHAGSWSIDQIVKQLKPKLVIIAKKSKTITRELPITLDAQGFPTVVRCANHGLGEKDGDSFDVWVPNEAKTWKSLF